MAELKINARREETAEVGNEHAIRFLGPEGPRVLSTPHMIGFMERTCRNLLLEMLEPGFDTVGTHVNVWHRAAAPMGSVLTFSAKLLSVTDGRAEFRVTGVMGDKVIGEGTHQRAIINVRRFREKVNQENPAR